MKHLFVPYELALLAKEKGFNEECIAFYDSFLLSQDPGIFTFCVDRPRYNDSYIKHKVERVCTAPLYQQLVDWLREKHDLVINVYASASGYLFEFHDSAKKGGTHRYDSGYSGPNDSGAWNEYYEAIDAALTEAFKLIGKNEELNHRI